MDVAIAFIVPLQHAGRDPKDARGASLGRKEIRISNSWQMVIRLPEWILAAGMNREEQSWPYSLLTMVL
jgi:hypothetical protein